MQEIYDHIFFRANYRTPDLHRHFAKHILLAEQGVLQCMVAGESFQCAGVMIQSNVLHTVRADSGPVLVFLMEETCDRAKKMDENYIGSNPYVVLDSTLVEQIRHLPEEAILSALGLEKTQRNRYDERIETVLSTIDTMETLGPGTIDFLSETVFLSKDRLSHLFREEVGISLAGYILLARLSKTYTYLYTGVSITTAAIHAGFSSSSHFAAVNKKQFGISVRDMGDLTKMLAKK